MKVQSSEAVSALAASTSSRPEEEAGEKTWGISDKLGGFVQEWDSTTGSMAFVTIGSLLSFIFPAEIAVLSFLSTIFRHTQGLPGCYCVHRDETRRDSSSKCPVCLWGTRPFLFRATGYIWWQFQVNCWIFTGPALPMAAGQGKCWCSDGRSIEEFGGCEAFSCVSFNPPQKIGESREFPK